MAYHLGVDLGTTYCAAAVQRDGQPAPEVVTLGASKPVMPSVVLLRADGTVLHGEAAERRAVEEPTRVGREFKRRLGDSTPLVLGGTPYGAEALMARLLRAIVALVTEREGGPPATVTLTHPANYGPYKLEQMREVANSAGLSPATTLLVTEPEAAALSYAARDRVQPGEVVAVYDFGGGTFDAALVRRDGDGFVLIGRPDGLERFGGIDIDAAIMAYVDDALGGRLSSLDADDGEVQAGVAHLREECRAAKEALSSDSDTSIPVSLPGIQTRVRLTRPELEGMLRPRLIETIEALERTVASAHLTMTDVSRILLVGGSSRIPLVGEMLRDRTHRPLAVDAHPKFAIAIGAALHGRAVGASGAAALAAPTRPVSVTPPVPAPPSVLAPPAAAVSASPPTPPPAPPPPPVPDQPFVPAVVAPTTGRSRTPWILAGLAALVVAVVVGVVVTRGGDDPVAGPTTDPTEPVTSQRASDPTVSVDTVSSATAAPVVSDAPVVTEPAPTTTFLSVPEPRELDEVADYVGYRLTVKRVSVAPVLDDFSTATNVTVTIRATNNGSFEPGIGDVTMRIDGLDLESSPQFITTPPDTTIEFDEVFSLTFDQLDFLPSALLVVGASSENRAVLPLGPDADPTQVVRHASAGADLAIDMTFGPGDRYVTGSLQVTHTDIGASSRLDQPPPAGKVWLSIDYQVCVQVLDSFFTPTLQLPDGTLVAPEGLELGGTTLHSVPLAVTCPRESVAVAFWAVDPAVVAGQTLTVLLDDEEDDQLPGSFTFTPPVLPPNDQVPS